MISQDRMEKALKYLAETDRELADFKTDVARFEYRAKQMKNTVFMHSEGTVAERNAMAENSPEYEGAMKDYFEMLAKHESMKNKRATEVLVFEAWRSLNSARTKGLAV